jgi:hypothetical protein
VVGGVVGFGTSAPRRTLQSVVATQLVVAFTACWIINGWRQSKTALKLIVNQSEAPIDAEQKSRS